MNTPEVTQLGISGLTLGILFFIVRWFVQTINKKDAQIESMTKNFTKVIENHMKHETDAFNNLAKVIDKLAKKIERKSK